MNFKVVNHKVWEPQAGPQTWLVKCPVREILFGGARGGGKSDGVLGEWAIHAQEYGVDAIGLCVRRERTQLVELIERSKVLYGPLGAKFNQIEGMWRFPNGARLRFAYLENDNDAQNYQGHSYTRVYVEEMGTFPNIGPILKLMATLRSGAGVPCKFIATANPGGPGHHWIKSRYIDPAPMGLRELPTEFVNPWTKEVIRSSRVFIPSKVTDNKYTNTPEYIANLYLAGHDNEDLIKAWLYGDWNVMLGSFFSEFDARKHVIKTFRPPYHWIRFMSMDWGSSKPFSIGWWCVVPDQFDMGDDGVDVGYENLENRSIMIPRGAIIRYKEWYGMKLNSPNIGLKYTVEKVAQGIIEREMDEPLNEYGRPKIVYRVADPSMAKQDGGPSIFERMGVSPYHLSFRRADNSRVPKRGAMGGWDMVRQRLKGENDMPMIYFMDNCVDAIRTLPALQHHPDNPEDVDTEAEDHAPDEIRYACMSRPYFRRDVEREVIDTLAMVNNNTVIIHDKLADIPMDNISYNGSRIH